MKLVISKQFQACLEGIGFSLEYVLERAGIPNILWKEELELSPMEYCRFLSELDEIITSSFFTSFDFMEAVYIPLIMPSEPEAKFVITFPGGKLTMEQPVFP